MTYMTEILNKLVLSQRCLASLERKLSNYRKYAVIYPLKERITVIAESKKLESFVEFSSLYLNNPWNGFTSHCFTHTPLSEESTWIQMPNLAEVLRE